MDLLLALLLGVALGATVAVAVLSGRSAGLRAALESERRLAGERLEGAQLVGPLREQLERVEDQLEVLQRSRVRAEAELREQVRTVAAGSERLGRETAALVDALRRPQARGRWGEVQLRRCVEYAGMVDRCDFTEQDTVAGTDGAVLRPDLVVRLAGDRCLVVDAKVTLAAYLEAVEAPDEQQAAARMAAHARHLRAHVDRLADKAYWEALPGSPEFVVLFLPGEAFLAPALEHDPALLEHAYRRRVHVATPTTLVSLLRTAAHAWQQAELADNAREVVEAGRELHARLAVLGGHVDKLGRSLGSAVADYNRAVGSLERSLLPASRRLVELGVEAEPVPAPTTVEALPRPLTAVELQPPLSSAG